MADPASIVWTTVNVLGFVFAISATGDALGDLRLIKKQKVNGARMLVGRANYRREILRTCQLAAFTLAGVLSMLLTRGSLSRVLIVGLLILAAMLTSISTILDRVVRYKLESEGREY